MGFRHQGRKTFIQTGKHSCGASWSRKVQRLPKDVNTGARRTRTLTQVVDELPKQAFDETSNERMCMSIEVGCKKASRLVSASQGEPEGPHSCKCQQNQLNHQGVKVHRTVRLREQTALCDKSVWSSSGEATRQGQLGTSSSGEADQEKQPGEQKTRPDIREQRPDAALDVLSAGTAQARGSRETPQQPQAPPDMQTGQSSRACLCREVPADHEAHSRSQRGQLRKNEC